MRKLEVVNHPGKSELALGLELDSCIMDESRGMVIRVRVMRKDWDLVDLCDSDRQEEAFEMCSAAPLLTEGRVVDDLGDRLTVGVSRVGRFQ